MFSDPRKNELLDSLPEDELNALIPHLELVNLAMSKELYQHGKKLSHAYFPITAIASLVYVLEDGSMTEIAVVGREGMLGISLIMGDGALGSAVVQSSGFAYRIEANVLNEVFNRGGALHRSLLLYTQMLLGQMARNTVSSRHYSIEQQLCRWLLERLDRLPSNEVKVTQELIANMLGVRRESVTQAAGKLQDEGLIQTSRGNITVIDRTGLESQAGECYKIRRAVNASGAVSLQAGYNRPVHSWG
ncbi:MAG: Crp/Fnr family transcriptional regulator [Pseudomonadota bacterium]